MKRFTILFLAIIVTVTFSYAQNGGKLMLVKGQKLAVENKVNTVTNMELAGNSMEVLSNVTSTNLIEIKDQKDKRYHLSNTITRLSMTSSQMGQEQSYDSDKKEDREGEMGKQLNDLLNKTYDVVLGENGKIVSGAVEKTNNAANDPAKGATTGMLDGAGDSKGSIEYAFIVIPTDSKVGYSWTDSSVAEARTKVTTYTIREINGNDAVLDMKGTMKSTTKMEVMGNELTTNTSGTLAGELTVDMSTGIIKYQSSTLNATGTMDAMGQQFPMTTKVVTKTTITSAK